MDLQGKAGDTPMPAADAPTADDAGPDAPAAVAEIANGVSFLIGVNHNEALRQSIHRAHAVEIAIHLAVFTIE